MQAIKSQMTARDPSASPYIHTHTHTHCVYRFMSTARKSSGRLAGMLLLGLVFKLLVLELLWLLRLVVLYNVVDEAEDGADAFLI